MRDTGQAFDLAALPEETDALREIEVSGGPRVFRTDHFEFETDLDVSKAFIAEAARVYEGTYYALMAIPHGLTIEPGQERTHFRGRFMSHSNFYEVVEERTTTIPGQRVVGLYLGAEQELLVPYASLGAKVLGSRMTLRKSSDTTTLVHEIVHQLTHRWLPVLPTWFSEGLAEYLASVPYQNGRFEFYAAERGLRERLEGQHRISGKIITGMARPSSFFLSPMPGSGDVDDLTSVAPGSNETSGIPGREWQGTVREYRNALLLLYYFMHLDQPEAAGKPVGAYLKLTDLALKNSGRMREDLALYEMRRLAYNEAVQEFNRALSRFRDEVAAYNERVSEHNEQARNGVPENERIVVGDPPIEPTPPKDIEIPPSLLSLESSGVDSLTELIQR
ncbi:MAG: hypothetical protein AAGC68_07140, partial [Verrucomicrobiota bacterium]